jgi:hypothetical protein
MYVAKRNYVPNVKCSVKILTVRNNRSITDKRTTCTDTVKFLLSGSDRDIAPFSSTFACVSVTRNAFSIVCRLTRHATLSEMLPLQHGVTFLFANDLLNGAELFPRYRIGGRECTVNKKRVL